MFVIHSLVTSSSNKDQPPNSSSQLVSILTAFVYYGFGVLVTYRYYQTGLLVVCAPKNACLQKQRQCFFFLSPVCMAWFRLTSINAGCCNRYSNWSDHYNITFRICERNSSWCHIHCYLSGCFITAGIIERLCLIQIEDSL